MQTMRRRLCAVSAVLGLSILLFLLLAGPTVQPARRFGVVIDAGSTGSRVHVFEFVHGKLEKETFLAIEPGLSTVFQGAHNDSMAAAISLRPLLAKARDTVPTSHHSSTDIIVHATAGLRKLGHAAADSILAAARREVEGSTQFNVRRVSLLDGGEEGVYAWLTVKYLSLQYEGEATPPAIIDLGGGSLQVVYQGGGGECTVTIGKHGGVFRESIPAGLLEARGRVGDVRDALHFLESFKACQPDVPSDAPVYAFSFFFKLLDGLLSDVTPQRLRSLAEEACESGDKRCSDFRYLYAVLRYAGVADTQLVHVRKKIHGKETAWPLGALLSQ